IVWILVRAIWKLPRRGSLTLPRPRGFAAAAAVRRSGADRRDDVAGGMDPQVDRRAGVQGGNVQRLDTVRLDDGDAAKRRVTILPDVFADEGETVRLRLIPFQALGDDRVQRVPIQLVFGDEQHASPQALAAATVRGLRCTLRARAAARRFGRRA